MALGTTSKYSESDFKPKLKIISSSIIPVEVFLLFYTYNQQKFTICDLMVLFEQKHKIKLGFNRMQQIAQDLSLAGKLNIDTGRNKQNTPTKYYSFKTIS